MNRAIPGYCHGRQLEHNIDDQESRQHQQQKNLTIIASDFWPWWIGLNNLPFMKDIQALRFEQLCRTRSMRWRFADLKCCCIIFSPHFDSYVIHGGFFHGNRKLKQLRSHFSIVFHILQVMGRLLHFYERHLHDVEYKDVYKSVSEALTELIDPDVLLDRAVNYCLFYAWQFLSSGKRLASEVLNENIDRDSITVGIPQERGFHSRPAFW